MSEIAVKIGFIGAGSFITANHLQTARLCPWMKIAAIAEASELRRTELKSDPEVGYVTDDYHQLLNDPDIDIIVIGTKQDLHCQLIIESLASGKWVWCEKPMCETQEEAAKIIAAERASKGRLAIGFNRNFAPSYTYVLDYLKKRPRPWFVNYRMQEQNPKKQVVNFYLNRPSIIYEGCHLLNLASFIFGTAPERVYMSGPEDSENDCVILEYADGSRFQLITTTTVGAAMGKEYMEIFADHFAAAVNEFTDCRVRCEDGIYDRVFAPKWGMAAEGVRRYGYDFFETLRTRMARPDYSPEEYEKRKIVRGQECREYESMVEAIADTTDWLPWQLRQLICDKGWQVSFEHFADAFRKGTAPRNADGKAGKLALDLGFALLESKTQKSVVTLSDYYAGVKAYKN